MLSRVQGGAMCPHCGLRLVARVFEWVQAETLMSFENGPPTKVSEAEVSWEDATGVSHAVCDNCGGVLDKATTHALNRALYGPPSPKPSLHLVH